MTVGKSELSVIIMINMLSLRVPNEGHFIIFWNYTVLIKMWLTATEYPYLKWQSIFFFFSRCFHRQYIWIKRWVSYKKQKPYTLCEHLDLPQCLVGSVLLILLVFSLVCLCFVCPRPVLSGHIGYCFWIFHFSNVDWYIWSYKKFETYIIFF